jgi:hypothetical protein
MASIQISAISFTQGCVNFCQLEKNIKQGGTMIHKHETTHSLCRAHLHRHRQQTWRSQNLLFSVLGGENAEKESLTSSWKIKIS